MLLPFFLCGHWFIYVDIKIGIKTHVDVEDQVKGRLNGQRSLKFPFQPRNSRFTCCICKFSITCHWGGGLGTTTMVGDDQICILRLSGLKCRDRFLGWGCENRRISKKWLEEQGMVVAWNRDQGACRVRAASGFKTYLGVNILNTILAFKFSFYL